MYQTKLFLGLVLGLGLGTALAQKPKPVKKQPPIQLNAQQKLEYTTDALGNRMLDFSYCGYRAGEAAILNVPIQIRVPVTKGDATARIQAAIDYVSKLPLTTDGFRGAVLLEKGLYEVRGTLKIRASGVVLRGSGIHATTLRGTGVSRDDLVTITGKNDQRIEKAVPLTDAYVPVNARVVHTHASLQPGDLVQIQRPSTKAWIDTLGMDHFGGGVTALGWKPGQRDLYWYRKVVAVQGNELTLDAPLTTALDQTFGGGTIARYTWSGKIRQCGLENLRMESTYDTKNPKDEDHRWTGVTLENVEDAWVRQVDFAHFAGSVVNVQETAQRITVEDCRSFEPISEIGGERRYTFYTKGQQTLFQRLYSEYGYHDFAVGFCATGPQVFVQCEAHLPHSFSGGVDSWASGVLFDIVNSDGNALRFGNLGQNGQGAGYNAANSVFWQCTAALVQCDQPVGAQNWAFGTWAQFAGNGYWEQSNEHIRPRSLYYAQLKERLGERFPEALMPVPTEASSSPPVSVAQELTQASVRPALMLSEFIEQASTRNAIPVETKVAALDSKIPAVSVPKSAPMEIKKGVLVRGEQILTGRRQEVPWWNGSTRPQGLKNAKPHITRFVPGRTGMGLTDNLDALTDSMQAQHILAIDHNYGLWYDRRRDDHERIRRMDGEVWAPFYELPFARSGKETAWDGLSKYDLTKYNQWYWNRLKQFADLADQKGLLLVHEHYFQHNIIEAGAHYADFPWRPVNNLNHTGFPEPVPYAGDKRVFMAEQFYDVTHPERRKLHRAYIRQCLNNFTGNTGVVQLIGAEYTGPLSFVQFWIDTIKEWEKETGKRVTVGLSTTKDVQDAILQDAKRAEAVDLIDIKYWHYQADGSVYAPAGGQNLALRQHARLLKPKRSSFEQVYRAVKEYREKYPNKAVTYAGDSYDVQGWAVLLAGGSMPSLPPIADGAFLQAAARMKPVNLPEIGPNQYALSDPTLGYILYNRSPNPITLTISKPVTVTEIDPETGKILVTRKGSVGKMAFAFGGKPTLTWIRFQ
ncbi:DUF6298 domain-containing protein [Siphonobacter sp.]|uniref:DUF6298 domain-containing protein n=1 Tax=Siphonobacter sp. TaxID=1869184 RepID=UPI003B3B54E0